MAEIYVWNNNLIPEEEWKSRMSSLRKPAIEMTMDKASALVADILTKAVLARVPKSNLCILFSGGLDSSAIAAICRSQGIDFSCCCIGMEGSHDLLWAEEAAALLGIELHRKVLSLRDIGQIIGRVAKILQEPHPVKVGVGAVTYAGLCLCKENNAKVALSGLGSEELFAGYERHRKAGDINAECYNGLLGMWERDLVRDVLIAKDLSIELGTPFLDERLIQSALQMSGDLKLNSDGCKMVLRRAALLLGLPPAIAERKKKAAQYGSMVDKAMGILAKKKGFSGKREYLDSLL